ncbi:MBL fold metallo-hydrolase [Pedobacter petrophilus]|uniref:MBL fold metallo-hydrolase n=1 Tax=Pedobacter petrophilus TaxID=1908241 RepID=A0A7K0G427_9SPHI|nr:MBL fold metallo-hydrolase [Pedobacter petrophilus]MRX78565.1 MBL fold metallo-hydrolase [Pedobacter petrophilus]
MEYNNVRFRRLGWSGVEIEYGDQTLLIDYITDTSQLSVLRSEEEVFPIASNPGRASIALLTHLHTDHADPLALAVALGDSGRVLRPMAATGSQQDLALTMHAESAFKKSNLSVEMLVEWEERIVGPFKISSAPAVDGFGDPQLSWVVECGGRRIIHAGDTLFHGFWWRIANKYGPFDAAFLPINAPIVDFPPLRPMSPIEAVMTPEQAAVAAHILGAKSVIPIHFGSMHKPPMYSETPNSIERLTNKLEDYGILNLVQQPGIWFEL